MVSIFGKSQLWQVRDVMLPCCSSPVERIADGWCHRQQSSYDIFERRVSLWRSFYAVFQGCPFFGVLMAFLCTYTHIWDIFVWITFRLKVTQKAVLLCFRFLSCSINLNFIRSLLFRCITYVCMYVHLVETSFYSFACELMELYYSGCEKECEIHQKSLFCQRKSSLKHSKLKKIYIYIYILVLWKRQL